MPNEINEQSSLFNLQHTQRTVQTYTLMESEIDSIGELKLFGTALLGFCTTSVGSAITFGLTLFTSKSDTGPYAWSLCAVLGLVSVVLAVLFGYSVRDYKRRIRQIKQRHNPAPGGVRFYGGGKIEVLSGPPGAE